MPLRVLIVEDEPLIAIHLEDILERAGHQVLGIADTMASALTIAEANPRLNLAIMDLVLARGANGIETARRLREEYDVASLFVSANLDERIVAMASQWQPVGFIGKPFVEEEILAVLPTSK